MADDVAELRVGEADLPRGRDIAVADAAAGIVKVLPGARTDPLQWELKAAFTEVARIYANATRAETTASPRSG